MAEIGKPEKYTAPETENPFIDALAPIVAEGVDTLFPVTFDADKYTAEKLQVQDAVRRLGFSARVHESDYEEDSGRKKVRTVFRVRPLRKSRDKVEQPETDGEQPETDGETVAE